VLQQPRGRDDESTVCEPWEMRLRVPDVVASAAAACGAGGWLRDLPGLIAGLEADWSVSVGRPFPHSSEAFVAEASLADGTPAVLKLLIPRDDAARGALLLERLGPSLYELGLPLAGRLEILVTAAATVWRPAAGSGLPTGADKARQLAGFVTTQWEELGHPCTEAAVEHALACAARRMAAHDDERAVLVHGDVHQLNALQVPGRETFKLVDPDGMLAEAECDLGVMMRNDPVELLDGDPRARAHWPSTPSQSPIVGAPLAGRCISSDGGSRASFCPSRYSSELRSQVRTRMCGSL